MTILQVFAAMTVLAAGGGPTDADLQTYTAPGAASRLGGGAQAAAGFRAYVVGRAASRIGAGGHAAAELRAYAVDRAASRVYVVTHRSGVFSFLGHEHAIVPLSWTPTLCLANPIPAGAHGTVVIDVASLVIDSDSARGVAHLGSGPSDSQTAQIQRKILDPSHLDAARFPSVRIEVVALTAAEGGQLKARATVALHGVTREAQLPIRVDTGTDGRVSLTGDLRIRQRDFGIQPETVAGVVKVSNEVDLHFLLVATPTGNHCGA